VEVAIAVIPKSRESQLRSKLKMLETLTHPNVFGVREIFAIDENFYVVKERLPARLSDQLTKIESEDIIASIIAQLISVLAFVHSLSLVHSNVKAENLLLSVAESFPILRLKKCTKARQEREANLQIGQSEDIRDAGLVAFSMLGKTTAPPDINQVVVGLIGAPWENVTDSAKDFLKQVLDPNTSTRVKAMDALQHPFIKGRLKGRSTLVCRGRGRSSGVRGRGRGRPSNSSNATGETIGRGRLSIVKRALAIEPETKTTNSNLTNSTKSNVDPLLGSQSGWVRIVAGSTSARQSNARMPILHSYTTTTSPKSTTTTTNTTSATTTVIASHSNDHIENIEKLDMQLAQEEIRQKTDAEKRKIENEQKRKTINLQEKESLQVTEGNSKQIKELKQELKTRGNFTELKKFLIHEIDKLHSEIQAKDKEISSIISEHSTAENDYHTEMQKRAKALDSLIVTCTSQQRKLQEQQRLTQLLQDQLAKGEEEKKEKTKNIQNLKDEILEKEEKLKIQEEKILSLGLVVDQINFVDYEDNSDEYGEVEEDSANI